MHEGFYEKQGHQNALYAICLSQPSNPEKSLQKMEAPFKVNICSDAVEDCHKINNNTEHFLINTISFLCSSENLTQASCIRKTFVPVQTISNSTTVYEHRGGSRGGNRRP